ncbi:MAG: hypothetical protein AVDCRST_MAG85-2742, partial [uncultured Solirubrobacteraceae bacterium]
GLGRAPARHDRPLVPRPRRRLRLARRGDGRPAGSAQEGRRAASAAAASDAPRLDPHGPAAARGPPDGAGPPRLDHRADRVRDGREPAAVPAARVPRGRQGGPGLPGADRRLVHRAVGGTARAGSPRDPAL